MRKPTNDPAVRKEDAKSFVPKPGVVTMLTEIFGINQTVAWIITLLTAVVLVGALFFFIHSAPPHSITITSGSPGSIFYTNAVRYAAILQRSHITLNIVTSAGSLENLQRLDNPSSGVDVGFVQGGVTNEDMGDLVSLGSISYQPLLVFYRGDAIDSLAGLAGKRLAIGPVGSGTRGLALTLLAANGIKPGEATTFLDSDAQTSAKAVQDGTADAVFLMGEDASVTIMHQLLVSPDIHLLNFAQAEAYTRRFSYLSPLKLPQGGIDLGKNIPAHDVYLVGPTVELVARKGLHPALSDLLLEAAQEVHGRATLLQHQGEFPAAIKHDLPISADANRFYRSGSGFFYRYLPFWLASLTSRIVVVFLPTVLVMIPVLRSIPHLYRWRIQQRIYRHYRALIVLERELARETDPKKREPLLQRLDAINQAVNQMKVTAYFATQFYGLREHIDFVRGMTTDKKPD